MKDITKLKQGDKIVIIMDGDYNFKYTVGQVYKFVKEQDDYIKVSVDGLEGEWAHTTLLCDHEWDFYVEPEEIHQWKLDDVVMISSSSEYYICTNESNPRDISGIIYNINDDDDHCIKVKWSNGRTNSYRPEDLVEFMDQTIVSYDGFNVGDKLPNDIVNDWTRSGCNEYTDSNKEWRKSVSHFNYDLCIGSIVRHEDGELAFKLKDINWFIRAKGFRDFMNEKTQVVPAVVPPPIPTAKFPYVIGEWIEFCNSIIRIERISKTHIVGNPWILRGELMGDGTWNLDNPIFLDAKPINVSNDKIQKALPGDSVYKSTYYPLPPPTTSISSFKVGDIVMVTKEYPGNDAKVGTIAPLSRVEYDCAKGLPYQLGLPQGNTSWCHDVRYLTPKELDAYHAPPPRFVVGQIVIATRDTPWWKKGNIGRINKIRDWNVFTVSIFKDGEFDDSNWTAVNDQFTEYNGNIHIRPGTAPEAFTVTMSDNWSTPVDKSAVKIVELEFQSPVLLKKKTKKSKLIIIN
jgi:hypothetical protein